MISSAASVARNPLMQSLKKSLKVTTPFHCLYYIAYTLDVQ